MRLVVGLCLLLSALSWPAAAATPERPKQLIILTSSAPETQALALTLANRTAAAGADIEMLLCDDAGDLALASPPASANTVVTPNGATPRRLLDMLLAKKARIHVCAIYLPNRKLDQKALMPAITPTNPDRIAGLLLDPAIKVIGY